MQSVSSKIWTYVAVSSNDVSSKKSSVEYTNCNFAEG